jgi:glycosyltransferase involved in cell wall biosynthesis
MNIVMLTNTYTPHVGGVARSVESFTREYRRKGHRTLVVAPEFPGTADQEKDLLRIPAIQNFNGSDFSLVLPVSGLLTATMTAFRPDIIHSHHPYLLGVTALRIARYRGVPLVFTHHTRYEEYSHYVPGDSPVLKRFIIEAATQYANLADLVIAPSESIRTLLREREITTPVEIVPTGVVLEKFSRGKGEEVRRQLNIPEDSYVVGHLGRLAPEKNIAFLARAVAEFIRHAKDPSSETGFTGSCFFLVIGSGPEEQMIRDVFREAGLDSRLHMLGTLQHPELADALAAMDVFAFSSKSETQGMVLTEAMAVGLPVVALDAPGAREVVQDPDNGRLLPETASVQEFAAALASLAKQPESARKQLREAARRTAEVFSMERTAEKMLGFYAELQPQKSAGWADPEESWEASLRLIKTEWDILKSAGSAAGAALSGAGPVKRCKP